MSKPKQILLYSNKTQTKVKRLKSQHVALREELKNCIISLAKDREYTQKELSDILGISQPRVSNLLNEDEQTFSIDALVNFLGKFGIKVKFNCYLHKTTLRSKARA